LAITLSCPSCEKGLKVKDELAGRKIKCPKCGSVFAVPGVKAAIDERVSAKKPSPAPVRKDDDEESEEEVPVKKKKKKKAKSNRGLLIGAAIGGLALVLIAVLFYLFWNPAKEKVVAKAPPPKVPAKQVKQDPVAEEDPAIVKKAPVGGIARARERTEIENNLRQLGIAYRQFEVDNNRGPKDQKELGPYYQNVATINDSLKNKWITFIWGVNRAGFSEGTSNTILAYETDADRQGQRFALMGDGSVQNMDEETFKKTPKAKGK